MHNLSLVSYLFLILPPLLGIFCTLVYYFYFSKEKKLTSSNSSEDKDLNKNIGVRTKDTD